MTLTGLDNDADMPAELPETVLSDEHVQLPQSDVGPAAQEDHFVAFDDADQLSDPRMHEDEGDGTLLDKQRREAASRQRELPAARRSRQRDARDRANEEINRLRARVNELEHLAPKIDERLSAFDAQQAQFNEQQVSNKIADLDRQIADSAHKAASARQKLSDAMINQDPEALFKAIEERDMAMLEGNRVQTARNILADGHPYGAEEAKRLGLPLINRPSAPPANDKPPTPAPQKRPVSSAEKANVEEFMARHSWYRADKSDPDQRVVLALDEAVMADGYRPDTEAYWNELDARMEKYLPHRFADDRVEQRTQPQQREPVMRRQNVDPSRRGPPVAGGADRGAAAQKNQVYVGPDRKAALMQAGVLDRDGRTILDSAKYSRLLKQFHEYDQSNLSRQ